MEPAADWPSCYHPEMASWSMEQAPDAVSCEPHQVVGWNMEPAAGWASNDHPQVASWTMEPAASYDHLQVASWSMEPTASYNHPQVASWIMEPTEGWASYDHPQLSSWNMEQAAWAPSGLLAEPMSTEMFGICHQISTPTNPIKQAEPQASEDDSHSMGSNWSTPEIAQETTEKLEKSSLKIMIKVDDMRKKIHMYPVSLSGIDEQYRKPNIVAIGPCYHPSKNNVNHLKDAEEKKEAHLKDAEEKKEAAAYYCCRHQSRDRSTSYLQIYNNIVGDDIRDNFRSYYDREVEGITPKKFVDILFYDACFLVQYMLYVVSRPRPGYAPLETEMYRDPSLESYFDSNDSDIYHDIMLLENQIPWQVVKSVIECMTDNSKEFIAKFIAEFIARMRDSLQEVKEKDRDEIVLVDDNKFKPPHLLGLLWFYIVGTSKEKELGELPDLYTKAVSPRKLAEAGIWIKANEKIDLNGMRINKKWPFFAYLYVPPLLLDSRPSWLINMAALEMCMSPDFMKQGDQHSAICSYLNLLTMLVHREKDVYDLRKNGLLQGGGGFTDNDALRFFSCLQGLRLGSSYARTMEGIQDYMHERRGRIMVYGFCYRNKKIIITFFSAIAAVLGILEALKTINVF